MGKAGFIAPDRVEAPLVLAIDIGTSVVRMMLFDRLGRALEDACWRHSSAVRISGYGASEVDADALLQIVWEGIDAVLAEADDPLAEKIAGVAACTFVGNVMGIDRKARPLTPVFTYADTRAEKQARRLRLEFEGRAVHARTGCRFHSSYLPEGLWCYRVDGVRSLPGGALSEGGNVFAWMKQTLRLGKQASLEQRISELKPDGHGLTLLPFLSGERSPGWQATARAVRPGGSPAGP